MRIQNDFDSATGCEKNGRFAADGFMNACFFEMVTGSGGGFGAVSKAVSMCVLS
ncbi:hypothetical protein [uncultured Ruminobacter sp.]|uniref:hypothetical protein n=1 Tax=uncultured Ruminobacter sp. TaxID=538947 RepID=UPI002630DE1B|nr:hypothetical protein [uncultured Ruminobacter sp.]